MLRPEQEKGVTDSYVSKAERTCQGRMAKATWQREPMVRGRPNTGWVGGRATPKRVRPRMAKGYVQGSFRAKSTAAVDETGQAWPSWYPELSDSWCHTHRATGHQHPNQVVHPESPPACGQALPLVRLLLKLGHQ